MKIRNIKQPIILQTFITAAYTPIYNLDSCESADSRGAYHVHS